MQKSWHVEARAESAASLFRAQTGCERLWQSCSRLTNRKSRKGAGSKKELNKEKFEFSVLTSFDLTFVYDFSRCQGVRDEVRLSEMKRLTQKSNENWLKVWKKLILFVVKYIDVYDITFRWIWKLGFSIISYVLSVFHLYFAKYKVHLILPNL